MARNYFKLTLKRNYDTFLFHRRDKLGPLLLAFFDEERPSDVMRAYEELVRAVVDAMGQGIVREDLLTSVFRRPDWEGPWERVPVVGGGGMGFFVDEGRAA